MPHYDGTPERKGSAGRIPDSRVAEHSLYQRVQFTMPPDIYSRLEKYCSDEERARSWAISKAIEYWLESKGY